MLTKHQQRQKEYRLRIREDEKFKQDTAKISIDVLSVLPVYILLEQYGWKRKRLTRFILRYSKIIGDLANKKINIQALEDHIKSETGLSRDRGVWVNLKKRV